MKCFKCLKNIENIDRPYHGLHEQCFLDWFNLSQLEPIKNLSRIYDYEGSAQQNEDKFRSFNTSFFQGKFKKYSASIGNKSYILKVQEKEYLELPAVEYFCNQLAIRASMYIEPEHHFIKLENKIDCFVTKNFMDNHFQAHNLMHIYHFLSENDEYSCEKLINIIESKTRRLKPIEAFIEICLFDALIGNHDRHGRNLALVENFGGYGLAPFYDNTSYLGIEDFDLLNAHHEPSGKIATSVTDEPKMIDYVIEFKRLGYNDIVQGFYEKFNSKCLNVEVISSWLKNSFMSKPRQQAMEKLIKRRFEELKNGLQK